MLSSISTLPHRRQGLCPPSRRADLIEEPESPIDEAPARIGVVPELEAAIGQQRLAQLGARLDVLEDLEARLERALRLIPLTHRLVGLPEHAPGGAALQLEAAAIGQLKG